MPGLPAGRSSGLGACDFPKVVVHVLDHRQQVWVWINIFVLDCTEHRLLVATTTGFMQDAGASGRDRDALLTCRQGIGGRSLGR